MSDSRKPIASIEDLLNHAYVLECDAEERYESLADQMEMANNDEVAQLFRKLAVVEGKHAQEIKSRMGSLEAPSRAPWEFDWDDMESPEAVDLSDIHYKMSPYHALSIALQAERRAYEFFSRVAEAAKDDDIRKLAAEFAKEEEEHVEIVQAMLKRTPPPERNWDEDPDPPGEIE